MKKRIIASTAFAACLALCAAMWPQNDPAVETSVLPTPPAVIAAQPEVSEMPEIEEIIMPEEEKTDVTQPEPIEEADAALEPIPVQTPLVSEVQTAPKQSATPLQERGLPRHHLTELRTTWSMCRASAGWKVKAPTMSNTPRTCTRTVIKSALWDKQKQYGIRPSLVPYCLFCFVLQCVAEYLVDTDQRNDLADKPLR